MNKQQIIATALVLVTGSAIGMLVAEQMKLKKNLAGIRHCEDLIRRVEELEKEEAK